MGLFNKKPILYIFNKVYIIIKHNFNYQNIFIFFKDVLIYILEEIHEF